GQSRCCAHPAAPPAVHRPPMTVPAAHNLVAIAPPAFDVAFDIRYARADNLVGRPIYRRAAAYLHADAAGRLTAAIAEAARHRVRLLIYDAFRPIEAQRAMFAAFPDPRFVSDPDAPRSSQSLAHPRGVAVDLSLLDAGGRPLDMG